ncbi:hypothetical protein GCM10027445_43680 [Amycolatopsis endophytica]|uniref:Uncharacterized protein n=1 Tax=Amycolatopsis endophytica TaxID=860233 RepID=A0A853BE22_9PSEU|nr:hypothetical protein [Amycolatopsis endophytica]NYI93270.1 hypothetical protein [Amycolatopsis endophytica]
MKVECSFSLLLRLAFWLAVPAVVLGVLLGASLGHQPEAAPGDGSASVVRSAGEEVPQCRPTSSN